MTWRTALAVVGALGAVACGDPLTDGSYRGAPIFKIEGQLTTRMPLSEDMLDADFAVSMFWAPEAGSVRPANLREQPSVTTNVRFPSTFRLRVFEPPRDEHFGGPDAAWVAGLVLVYIDGNRDGRYGRRADALVGASLTRGLVYARTDLAAADSPTQEELPMGFSVIDLPLETSCASLPEGGASSPVERSEGFSCSDCRRGFRCDREERVCVPDETFNLVIVPDLQLAASICRPN